MISTETKIEWRAWQKVVKELKNKGIDINVEKELSRVIKEWGEQYYKHRKRWSSDVNGRE